MTITTSRKIRISDLLLDGFQFLLLKSIMFDYKSQSVTWWPLLNQSPASTVWSPAGKGKGTGIRGRL